MHKSLLMKNFTKSTIKISRYNITINDCTYKLVYIMAILRDLENNKQALIFDYKLRDILMDRGVISSGLSQSAHCMPGKNFKEFLIEINNLITDNIDNIL